MFWTSILKEFRPKVPDTHWLLPSVRCLDLHDDRERIAGAILRPPRSTEEHHQRRGQFPDRYRRPDTSCKKTGGLLQASAELEASRILSAASLRKTPRLNPGFYSKTFQWGKQAKTLHRPRLDRQPSGPVPRRAHGRHRSIGATENLERADESSERYWQRPHPDQPFHGRM